jgi:hypothetical protein
MVKTRAMYFFLIVIALLGVVVLVQAGRPQAKTTSYLRWEYHVVEYGASGCAADELQLSLTKLGEQGWEVVNVTPISNQSSEIVLQSAALSYGKEVVPNLADSLQGVITPLGYEGCRVVFKRPGY